MGPINQKVIEYLGSEFEEEFGLAVKIAGSVTGSSNSFNVDSFIFHGGLTAINKLLKRDIPNNNLKEVLWCLSNITAGTDDQIRAIL